ncbi:hypothetical protein [Kribbella sp. CA-247076]|uniref:hypothetical protein n=1 Tax=Kribbella sp. CA-247076 TaxID=3239941 RepID=UPI003D9464B6
MEPLNLMVSLSHFGDSKSTLPPKQPRRGRKSRTAADCVPHVSVARRWLRVVTAR